MLEPISIGIASNIIFAGGSATRAKARKLVEEKKYSEDLDRLGTKFNSRLRDAIEDVAEEQGRDELKEIIDNWADIAVHLDQAEIIFEDQEEAIEQISDAIINAAPESIYAEEQLRPDLCLAVSYAYDRAVKNFQSDIAGTELGDELNQRANVEISKGVRSVLEEIDDLKQQFSPREYFEVFDTTTEREAALEHIADHGGLNTDIGYIENEDVLPDSGQNRILLTGEPGSGKTRTLLHLSEEFLQEGDITEVIVPDEAFVAARDIAPLLHKSYSGDVLLIWDDIHTVLGEDTTQVVRETILKLEKEVPEDAQLWVIGTAVASSLERILRESSPSHFLDSFDRITQPDLSNEQIEAFLTEAATAYDVEIDQEKLEKIVTQIKETNPSPGYIQTLFETLPDDTEEFTFADVEEVPPDTITLWEEEYRNLRQSNRDSTRLLLCAKTLSQIHAPLFESLMRGLFVDALDRDPVDFAASIEQLQNSGWLKTTSSPNLHPDITEYTVHGVKEEAILDDIEGYLESLSEFLLTDVEAYIPDTERGLEPVLQSSFAARFSVSLQDDQVEKHHQRALDLAPMRAPVHSNYAVWLKYQGRLEEAETHYQRSTELAEDSPMAMSNYGVFLEELGYFEEAEDYLERALELEDLPIIQYNYANLKRQMGEYDTAESYFSTAISESSDESAVETDARIRYALLLLDEGQIDEAETHLDAALQANPASPEANQTYAKLMVERGEDDVAEEHYEKAIEYGRENVSIWIEYAEFLLGQERGDDLVSLYHRAPEEVSEDEMFKSTYASGLSIIGDYDEARQVLEELLEEQAASGNILLVFQSYHLLVNVCIQQGDFSSALVHCQTALELLSKFEPGGEFEELKEYDPLMDEAPRSMSMDAIQESLKKQYIQLKQLAPD